MTVSHEALQRSLGRVEATQENFKERMDRFEKKIEEGFEKVEGSLSKIDARLAKIEATENERKGAWKTIAAVAGLVSAAVASVFKYLIN